MLAITVGDGQVKSTAMALRPQGSLKTWVNSGKSPSKQPLHQIDSPTPLLDQPEVGAVGTTKVCIYTLGKPGLGKVAGA